MTLKVLIGVSIYALACAAPSVVLILGGAAWYWILGAAVVGLLANSSVEIKWKENEKVEKKDGV